VRTIIVLAAALCAAACGAAPTPLQQAEAASYGGDQALCIAKSPTKAETDQCRDAVKEYWCSPDGGALFEAGACLNVTLSNGERP
jgi:hypothetical protein